MFVKDRYSDTQKAVILGLYTIGMCLWLTPVCAYIDVMYGEGFAAGLVVVTVTPVTLFMAWRTIR